MDQYENSKLIILFFFAEDDSYKVLEDVPVSIVSPAFMSFQCLTFKSCELRNKLFLVKSLTVICQKKADIFLVCF